MREWVVLAVMAAMALSGCIETEQGSDPTEPGAPVDGAGPETTMPEDAPTMAVSISAVGAYPFNPAFDPMRIEVAAGTVLTVTFTNEDSNPFIGHDLKFSGVEAQTPVISNGESTELTFLVDLEPGEYPYWCAVGNHREQGMEGVLVVT